MLEIRCRYIANDWPCHIGVNSIVRNRDLRVLESDDDEVSRPLPVAEGPVASLPARTAFASCQCAFRKEKLRMKLWTALGPAFTARVQYRRVVEL
jgi:hypothetical protein